MSFGEPCHNKEKKTKKTKTGTRCGSPNRLPGPAQQGSGGWRVARDSAAGTGLIFFFILLKLSMCILGRIKQACLTIKNKHV